MNNEPSAGCGVMLAIALAFALLVAIAVLGYYLAPYFRHLT